MRSAAKTVTMSPPVGGWDTRNAIADMPAKNAIVLDNWFPGTDTVEVRGGHTEHSTGMSGAVESLLEYVSIAGVAEIFAANGGNIYDATAAGAVPTAAVTGMTNDRWQSTQISTSGGHFLFAVNGADAPRGYDGTSWTTPTITATGLTAANLVWCNSHQERLWFGEEDSLNAWYLPTQNIAGTAVKFPMGAVFNRGGYIMAMGTWTRDAGDGADDLAVFITSEGEVAVYAGTDPSAAATWTQVGVFRVGRPIGRRCVVKAGPDLVMITEDGFVAASTILSMDRAQTDSVALSAQINEAVNTAVQSYGTLFGWQPILYPTGTQFIVNIPQSATTAHQYVFNTITGAPCRFTGQNALCWALKGDSLFFGGADGKVYQADNGNADNASVIDADALPAFYDFGSPGRTKAFKRVDPIFTSDGDPNAAINLNIDFKEVEVSGLSPAAEESAAKWGAGKWSEDLWGTAGQIYRGWRGVRGQGTHAALRVRVRTSTTRPSWIATKYLFTPGGAL